MLDIIPRSEWGKYKPTRSLTNLEPGWNTKGWVLHWPGPAYTGQGSYADELRIYERYHVVSKGWSYLAYNFAVAPDGTVFEGRGWRGDNIANQGAFSGNTYSLLFLRTGRRDNGTEMPVSPAAVTAARELIAEHPGDGTIMPHFEASQTGTACPGANIVKVIPELKVGSLVPKPPYVKGPYPGTPREGNSPEIIMAWQEALNELDGEELDVDGVWGPATAAAVARAHSRYHAYNTVSVWEQLGGVASGDPDPTAPFKARIAELEDENTALKGLTSELTTQLQKAKDGWKEEKAYSSALENKIKSAQDALS